MYDNLIHSPILHAPTVLRDIKPEAKNMQEEIFGPLLPVLNIGSMDEAINFITRDPLIIYYL